MFGRLDKAIDTATQALEQLAREVEKVESIEILNDRGSLQVKVSPRVSSQGHVEWVFLVSNGGSPVAVLHDDFIPFADKMAKLIGR